MTASFLPEYSAVPVRNRYRGAYKLFDTQPYRFIPGAEEFETAGKALAAAKEYVRIRLNPPIRGEITEARDVLGLQQWHVDRAARQAEAQEQALGGIVVRGRQVKVERKERA